jgi:hypothetical protein
VGGNPHLGVHVGFDDSRSQAAFRLGADAKEDHIVEDHEPVVPNFQGPHERELQVTENVGKGLID